MINDIKKSISSVLYERTTSPFFGTLICSWLLWNWKIVYLTLFISEKYIVGNKIDYITTNLVDTHRCVTYPLLSTLVLLTIIPFISNGAYWLTLKFTKWRKDEKNKIEMQQLLTLEQSIELREQISLQEERFEKLLKNKNLEIDQLRLQITNSKTSDDSKNTQDNGKDSENLTETKELNALAERIKNNPTEMLAYETTLQYVQKGYGLTDSPKIGTKFINLLESHDIIQAKGSGIYQFTPIGKKFNKLMTK